MESADRVDGSFGVSETRIPSRLHRHRFSETDHVIADSSDRRGRAIIGQHAVQFAPSTLATSLGDPKVGKKFMPTLPACCPAFVGRSAKL